MAGCYPHSHNVRGSLMAGCGELKDARTGMGGWEKNSPTSAAAARSTAPHVRKAATVGAFVEITPDNVCPPKFSFAQKRAPPGNVREWCRRVTPRSKAK